MKELKFHVVKKTVLLVCRSAHPNPWRPPTLWEMSIPGNISDFNLGTWTQPTLTKQELTMEHSDLGDNMKSMVLKGIAAGAYRTN